MFQGLRHAREKAAVVPAGLRWRVGPAMRGEVIVLEDKALESLGQTLQVQTRGGLVGIASRCIARQVGKQPLIDRVEKPFDPPAAPRFGDLGEDRSNVEVGTDLL